MTLENRPPGLLTVTLDEADVRVRAYRRPRALREEPVFPRYRFNTYPFFHFSLRKVLCGFNAPTLRITYNAFHILFSTQYKPEI